MCFLSGMDKPTVSRLSGKNRPSQQLFKAFIVFYTSTATCFGLHWLSSGGTHNIIYKEVIFLQRIRCLLYKLLLCTLFDKCCHRLSKCDYEVYTRACNHLVFQYQMLEVWLLNITIIKSNYKMYVDTQC
jgi:hypothetical protein